MELMNKNIQPKIRWMNGNLNFKTVQKLVQRSFVGISFVLNPITAYIKKMNFLAPTNPWKCQIYESWHQIHLYIITQYINTSQKEPDFQNVGTELHKYWSCFKLIFLHRIIITFLSFEPLRFLLQSKEKKRIISVVVPRKGKRLRNRFVTRKTTFITNREII